MYNPNAGWGSFALNYAAFRSSTFIGGFSYFAYVDPAFAFLQISPEAHATLYGTATTDEIYGYSEPASEDWGAPTNADGYEEGAYVGNRFGSWVVRNGKFVEVSTPKQLASRASWRARNAQQGGFQIDPLKKHMDQAVTLDQWVQTYEGSSYFAIITEAGWKDGQPWGQKLGMS